MCAHTGYDAFAIYQSVAYLYIQPGILLEHQHYLRAHCDAPDSLTAPDHITWAHVAVEAAGKQARYLNDCHSCMCIAYHRQQLLIGVNKVDLTFRKNRIAELARVVVLRENAASNRGALNVNIPNIQLYYNHLKGRL